MSAGEEDVDEGDVDIRALAVVAVAARQPRKRTRAQAEDPARSRTLHARFDHSLAPFRALLPAAVTLAMPPMDDAPAEPGRAARQLLTHNFAAPALLELDAQRRCLVAHAARMRAGALWVAATDLQSGALAEMPAELKWLFLAALLEAHLGCWPGWAFDLEHLALRRSEDAAADARQWSFVRGERLASPLAGAPPGPLGPFDWVHSGDVIQIRTESVFVPPWLKFERELYHVCASAWKFAPNPAREHARAEKDARTGRLRLPLQTQYPVHAAQLQELYNDHLVAVHPAKPMRAPLYAQPARARWVLGELPEVAKRVLKRAESSQRLQSLSREELLRMLFMGTRPEEQMPVLNKLKADARRDELEEGDIFDFVPPRGARATPADLIAELAALAEPHPTRPLRGEAKMSIKRLGPEAWALPERALALDREEVWAQSGARVRAALCGSGVALRLLSDGPARFVVELARDGACVARALVFPEKRTAAIQTRGDGCAFVDADERRAPAWIGAQTLAAAQAETMWQRLRAPVWPESVKRPADGLFEEALEWPALVERLARHARRPPVQLLAGEWAMDEARKPDTVVALGAPAAIFIGTKLLQSLQKTPSGRESPARALARCLLLGGESSAAAAAFGAREGCVAVEFE